jgi:Protein of unknown function (DUF3732)
LEFGHNVQIETIVLYSLDGRTTEVRFHAGTNIVTGISRTGKSALIPIVEYCMGSRECMVPDGVVRRSVSWYGTMFAFPDGKLFVARREPGPPSLSSTDIYVAVGENLAVPPMSELAQNSNSEALNDLLTARLGIAEAAAERGATGEQKYRITLKHARHYCFLEQEEIARKTALFHRQDKDHEQAIRETFPYFVGAMKDDRFPLLRRLDEDRRVLRRLERDLDQLTAIADENPQAVALAKAAQRAGLIPENVPADATALSYAVNESQTEQQPADLTSDIAELRAVRDSYLREQRTIRERIEMLRALQFEEAGYGQELDAQRARLQSVDLVPDDGEPTCPVCRQGVAQRLPSVQRLQESLVNLQTELQSLSMGRPRLAESIARLEERRGELSDLLRRNQQLMNELQAHQDRMDTELSSSAANGMVRGRVLQFLEMTGRSGRERERLADQIQTIRSRIEDLETQLSWSDVMGDLEAMLSHISDDLTSYANELDAEWKDKVSIDPTQLTIVANTKQGRLRLRNIGSASNWVAYHLAAFGALHKWFALRNRPVPRFIMFDQPTMPYLSSATGEIVLSGGNDATLMDKMFSFLLSLPNETEGRVQVIVMDHARLSHLPGFDEAVVANWHHGEALVPPDWERRPGYAEDEP